MGLHAEIYRTPDGTDCTLRGWSSRFTHVCVVNADGPFEPDERHPAVLIRRHRSMPALHVVSVQHFEAGQWTMFGGNFLYSSDSRFGEACRQILIYGNSGAGKPAPVYSIPHHMCFGAINIHDRVEN